MTLETVKVAAESNVSIIRVLEFERIR
ncbi:hypothetical protein BN165_1720005 [Clostridioides difficile E1]|nr:hypothetical protein BN165_1720005 [Clostridioides difficile E1]